MKISRNAFQIKFADPGTKIVEYDNHSCDYPFYGSTADMLVTTVEDSCESKRIPLRQ